MKFSHLYGSLKVHNSEFKEIIDIENNDYKINQILKKKIKEKKNIGNQFGNLFEKNKKVDQPNLYLDEKLIDEHDLFENEILEEKEIESYNFDNYSQKVDFVDDDEEIDDEILNNDLSYEEFA